MKAPGLGTNSDESQGLWRLPGSMPMSNEIYQEGIIIPPIKLIEGGRMNQGVMALLLSNVRTPDERAGDLQIVETEREPVVVADAVTEVATEEPAPAE